MKNFYDYLESVQDSLEKSIERFLIRVSEHGDIGNLLSLLGMPVEEKAKEIDDLISFSAKETYQKYFKDKIKTKEKLEELKSKYEYFETP